MKKGLIFDMDGTLWDSSENVAASWTEKIRELKYDLPDITQKDIMGVMGLTMDKIADILFGSLSKDERMELLNLCCEHENEYLRKHGGNLYPELENTLIRLKENYHLYIVSNCQDGYIQVFLEAHKMHQYFDGFICAGDSGMSKGQNNLLLMRREGLKFPVYVGDTEGDMNSAIEAEIPFVFCRFGFGKAECEHNIDKLSQLPALLKEI